MSLLTHKCVAGMHIPDAVRLWFTAAKRAAGNARNTRIDAEAKGRGARAQGPGGKGIRRRGEGADKKVREEKASTAGRNGDE